MSGQCYTTAFKDEAVKLITERGYSVTDVAECLGVSQYSLYTITLMNMNYLRQRKKSYALKVNLNKLKRSEIS
ncbi:transposase [Acinetobacter sp. B5B]|uniref:transposase n=1 Tax=Acinetobacter baretiae TaxID=2605383 RepID=UPI0018C26FC9|nr:transposase [Acinetobacter baretiae]MBF7683672.1 transposase [Acinetobacter baretiae]MBF7686497.1 transposase [Acinetobacter baretiae]